MAHHLGDNPQLLAGIVTSMGGTVHEGTKHFNFELPLAKVPEVIPKLNELGVRVERIGHYEGTNPRSGKAEGIVILEAIKG